MIFGLCKGLHTRDAEFTSNLYDQNDFYGFFTNDLINSKEEVIIESPFMTTKRIVKMLPIFKLLRDRGVRLVINTRDPVEHESMRMQVEAQQAIMMLQRMGAEVLYTVGHHRKLAILDRKIVWEGSLNILSQNDSCEIMRRIYSRKSANEMLRFLDL